ncbi:MAG: M15 family metallopeptidase [Mycobacteriaceae bacterium]|nr:M15 family metallopeptidase [Mycobacteriaceae bacterium]
MIATHVLLPTAAASGQPESVAPNDFVTLLSVDPTIAQDIRYFTAHNFTGEPVDGYLAPLCILTRAAAQGLQRAQQQLIQQGYALKVYDCYRPQRAVNAFIAWAEDLSDQRMKTEFYPHIDKSTLFRDGYIAERSGHSRGSTMDLTLIKLPAAPVQGYLPGQPLVDCTAPASARFPDDSIDMGTGFDCFDTLAHTLDPRIQKDQLKNRQLLTDVLRAQGFVNYEYEWWHFTYQPEPYPDTYFDFPVEQSSLH